MKEMDSESKNDGEMIDKIKINLNSKRKDVIKSELIEII
jgi:F0F1-type ATP synthase gamma subunit